MGGFPREFLPEGHVYLEKREKEIPTSSKVVFWQFVVNVGDSYLIPASGWAAPARLEADNLALIPCPGRNNCSRTSLLPSGSTESSDQSGSFSFFFPSVVQRSKCSSLSPVTTVFVCAGASGFQLPPKAEAKSSKKSPSQGILGSSKVRRFWKQNRGIMR